MESKTISENRKSALSRRQFLAAVGAAGTSLLALGGTSAAATVIVEPAAAAMKDPMTLAALKGVAGSVFNLQTAEGQLSAVLDRVVENNVSSNLQQYTAVFRLKSNATGELTQRTYDLNHPELGQLSLLLSPSEAGSVTYMSAAFCQLIE